MGNLIRDDFKNSYLWYKSGEGFRVELECRERNEYGTVGGLECVWLVRAYIYEGHPWFDACKSVEDNPVCYENGMEKVHGGCTLFLNCTTGHYSGSFVRYKKIGFDYNHIHDDDYRRMGHECVEEFSLDVHRIYRELEKAVAE
jgi:hypothetical protein